MALQGGGKIETSSAGHTVTTERVKASAAKAEKPARLVTFSMAGEDMRALLSRLLLFTAAGAGPVAWRTVFVSVERTWAVGCASEGIVMGIQKIRCEADDSAVLALAVEDARAILSMIPKPRTGLNAIPLSDVRIDFMDGGAEDSVRPVNVLYSESGRVRSYSCENGWVTRPDFRALTKKIATAGAADEARLAVNPEYMGLVAKAAKVARDQMPVIVRWRFAGEMPASKPHEEPPVGTVVASFVVHPQHDLFAAFIAPMAVAWTRRDALTALQADLFTLSGETERLRPVMASVLS